MSEFGGTTTVHYRIEYIDTQSSGWSFFGFRRNRNIAKCEKCKQEKAIMSLIDKSNELNRTDVCIVCYNRYNIDDLLLVTQID